MVNTYSFNIEREGTAPHSIDRRIAATVIDILRRWFDFYNDGTLSSRSAEAREGYYQLLVSIYFKNDNPNRQQLLRSFNELMSRDIYEIVV
jgi:hypothetical protein